MKKVSLDREIQSTKDGSKTLYIKDLNENYHSHHGALQEAKHVFIKNGLNQLEFFDINILELGFGTGLNVLVTVDEFLRNRTYDKIRYFTVEKYPVTQLEISTLNYGKLFKDQRIKDINDLIHQAPWERETEIFPNFHLTKIKADFFNIDDMQLPKINLVYFDCFGARVQPDLWEKPLFEIVAAKMQAGGLLTTYSSKGSVRRILHEIGFRVEKKAGPPGKREMINAWKLY